MSAPQRGIDEEETASDDLRRQVTASTGGITYNNLIQFIDV